MAETDTERSVILFGFFQSPVHIAKDVQMMWPVSWTDSGGERFAFRWPYELVLG